MKSTTKPLRIGRHTILPAGASAMVGTHIMVYDPASPEYSYIKGMFGLIGADRGAADEQEARTNAALFAHAAQMRDLLLAITTGCRQDDENQYNGAIFSTTTEAALQMAETLLADLNKLIGE